jgi:hypothetical protein
MTNRRIPTKSVTADASDCAADTFGRCHRIAGGKRTAGCDGKYEKVTNHVKLPQLEEGYAVNARVWWFLHYKKFIRRHYYGW